MAKFLRHVLTSVSFLGLFFSLSSAARAETIDPFMSGFGTDPLWVGTNNLGLPPNATSTVGTRLANLSSSTTTGYIQASINTTNHKLIYSRTIYSGTPAGSGKLVLNYGYSTPLNLNLTADHSNMFQISILLNNRDDNLPVTINVFCYASDGVTVQTPPAKTYLVNGVSLIRFTDFPNCNFQNVKQIVYTFDATSLNFLSYDLEPLKTVYSSY